LNYKLPDIEAGKPWYKCFGDEVTLSMVEEVTNHIMELYKKDTDIATNPTTTS